MRISDWSSDVCSSDLAARLRAERASRSVLPIDGDAWDIARAVAFLASDEARWITGQTLSVDGGAPLIRPNPQWRSHHSSAKAPRSCTESRRCGNAPEPCSMLTPGSISKRGRMTAFRSAEHKSELHSLMRISYAGFGLKTK